MLTSKRICLVLLLVVWGILACNYRGLASSDVPVLPEASEVEHSEPFEPETLTPDPFDQMLTEFEQHLEDYLPSAMVEYNVPGLAIALLHDGEVVWVRTYGLANQESNIPVTLDTVFQVASLSKTVTAWGVMRLVEADFLELDAPVEHYLTRWRLPPSDFDHDGVTIQRLLSHTAGLSLHGYPGFPPDEPLPTLEESLSGATNGAGDVRVVQEPGSGFSYSGGGYTLLQLVVEEVTGESFASYMQREVLRPLGMTHSAYEWLPELQPATAIGYDEDGDPYPNYLFTAQAAAGLYSTISDYALFLAASMPGPGGEPLGRSVISPEALSLMLSPHPESGGEYGFGYAMEELPGSVRLASHWGGNYGWTSYYALWMERGVGLVVLTNADNGDILIEDIIPWWLECVGND